MSAVPEVDVTWSYTATNVKGFSVERSTDKGKTYTALGTVDTSTKSYRDTDVKPGTTYYYRVKALNGAYVSPYSSAIYAAVPLVPAVPTGVAVSPRSGMKTDTAYVTWRSVSGATGYVVE